MTLKELLVRIGVDASGIDKGMADAETRLSKFGSKFSAAGLALTAAVSTPILGVGTASLKMAVDVVESENLFKESFKGMSGKAQEWSESTSSALGLNAFELRRNSGLLYTMLGSMGQGKDAAFDMSTGLTKLAYDMASFYNLDPAMAFDKLRAGISGETEPLKQLGILVDQNTIKHYALAAGLIEQGQEMSSQVAVQARYLAILDQTKNAQGDLARTLDSPSNQMRVLGQRVTQTATEFGVALLPVLTAAIPVARNLAEGVAVGVRWFSELPTPIKGGAAAFALMVAGIGPLMLLLGGIASGAGAIAAILPGMAVAEGVAATGATTLGAGATGAAGGLTLLRSALGFAGQAALVFATAMAAWKVGSWIGEVSGATDWIGKKLAGALYGVSEAEYEATRAAAKATEGTTAQATAAAGATAGYQQLAAGAGTAGAAHADFSAKLAEVKAQVAGLTSEQRTSIAAGLELGQTAKDVADALGLDESAVRMYAAQTKESTKQTNAFQTAVDGLVSRLNGGEAINAALQWVAALREIGGTSRLTKAELTDYLEVIDKAVEKMTALGQAIPQGWQQIANGIHSSGVLAATQEQLGGSLALLDGYQTKLLLTSSALPAAITDAAMHAAPPNLTNQGVSGAGTFMGGLATELKSKLGPTIMSAFTGGGDLGKSIGGLIGGQVFGDKSALSGVFEAGAQKIGGLFGGTLGGSIGSALGSVVPGLGTLLGGMAGQLMGPMMGKVMDGLKSIGGAIKNLFGGPDAQEMEGRSAAGQFREELEAAATAAQRAEAGNDRWKLSVIAIRDAYIEAGHTEAEALDAAARLYAAEKQGGDAVRVVSEEIARTMKEAVAPETAKAAAAGVLGFADVQRQVQALQSTTSDPRALDDLTRQMNTAAAAGVTDFSFMAGEIDKLKAQIATPVTVPVFLSYSASGSRVGAVGTGSSTEGDENSRPADPNEMAKLYFSDAHGNESYLSYWLRKNTQNGGQSDLHRAVEGFGGDQQAVANAFGNLSPEEQAYYQSHDGSASVPAFAAGGIVTGPMTGLVGEAGPEAILPLDRLHEFLGDEEDGGYADLVNEFATLRAELPMAIAKAVRDYAMTGGRR